MATSFTDWESDYLEHHGIPGMKWGVRRYQNKDGSLTIAGQRRYGMTDAHTGGDGSSRKKAVKTSASKMQKDFNNLDRGYATVEARRKQYETAVRREMHKANNSRSDKRYEKHKNVALEAAKNASEAHSQKKAIESLQWRIIGTAAKRGYTINSTPVIRSIKAGMDVVNVHGQEISIRKYGSGRNNVINYKKYSGVNR